MQWLELHSVGFGECMVLGGRRQEILMVDCGSMNRRLQTGISFSQFAADLTKRYGGAAERSFLLSHFHKDHYCGLPAILQEDPQFFDRIYVPSCPVDEHGVPILMELSILIEAFVTGPGSETVKMHAASLRFFQKLCHLAGTESVFSLSAGDQLLFDGEVFDVLWPQKTNYPFAPELKKLIVSANQMLRTCPDSHAAAFLELKEALCNAYLHCMDAFAYRTEADAAMRQAALLELDRLIDELNLLLPWLHVLQAGQKVRQLLSDRKTVMALSMAVNGAGLILSSEDTLFTGDAEPAVMEAVRENLQEDYRIVKVPHHGTASCWWDGFRDLGITHLLISNGKAITGGKISAEYASLNAMHHCTGGDHCQYREEAGQCCNGMLCCPDTRSKDGNPAKCRKNFCRIYQSGVEQPPCFCDGVLKIELE